jgi:hypothetical protein
MGPALQRLLSRPSSLEFLRYLVGPPTANAPAKRRPRLSTGERICGYRYVSMAVAARDVERYEVEEEHQPSDRQSGMAVPAMKPNQMPTPMSTSSSALRTVYKPWVVTGLSSKKNQRWNESLFTHEQLEFESNLEATAVAGRPRLLDRHGYNEDLKLWACLFEYRKRIHGLQGVLTFWSAIQKRNLHLPTKGHLAEKFWPEFLALGFQDRDILEEVCVYADRLLDETGERWSRLYVSIIEHFLINWQGDHARRWHERLFRLHLPGSRLFAEMCRYVEFRNGDIEALRRIYTLNKHRNVYSRVVPLLCQREDFKGALNWHFFFLRNGDLPRSSRMVEPLVHFLAIYDRPNARRVMRSLVDAGVSFASTLSNELENNTKISREMMNLVHGETFNISVKKYNDTLGARWFATRWVPLDVAINAVHALGIQEIGPLSLQAIALRDPDAKAVVIRITQLRDLGISIGSSMFARAVEHFAKNREFELLNSLLSSDQHPEELEDGKLQESLLETYARAKDWTQYRRTLALRSLVSKSPEIEKSNIVLRYHVTRGSKGAVMDILTDMQVAGIPVTSKSIAHIIRCSLRPRRTGHRPMTQKGMWNRAIDKNGNDTNVVIAILKRLMKSGSFVPILHWREIIRRLGMAGRFNDLQQLCRELAAWYNPAEPSSIWPPHHRRYRIPAQVSTSHHLHPLRMLFNVPLQKAIVEWGFIHNLKHRKLDLEEFRQGKVPAIRTNSLPIVTSGITLLKQLSQHGVHIDGKCVRSAIFNRLITYYGPGRSNRRYNRTAKAILHGKMALVAKQIDDALGGKYFTAVDLPRIVNEKAATRWRRVGRRWNKNLDAKRVVSSKPRIAWLGLKEKNSAIAVKGNIL